MSNAKTFLQDLYDLDPSLRAHEAELLPLIEQLLASDPSLAPNKDFVAALQVSLREHAANLSAGRGARSSLWNNLLYVLGGMATATAVFAITFASLGGGLPKMMNANSPVPPAGTTASKMAPLFAFQVEDAKPGAFGSLESTVQNPADAAGLPRPQGGGGGMGGGGGVATATAPQAMMGGDAKMIAPWPSYQYNYVFNGKLPDLTTMVDVYKHTPKLGHVSLGSLAGNFDLGMLDLSSFDNLNVQSLSLTQDKPFGYQITVDLQNAQVSLNSQWDQWPQSKCTTDECYAAERVKIGDILSDDKVISVAKTFLTQHGIDLANYGNPQVDNAWRNDYETAENKTDYYIPDSQRVVFPLVIDGQTAYDQSGTPTGISVGVSVKQQRVSDIYGLGDRTYVKSSYAGLTDSGAIMTYLKNLDGLPYGIMMKADVGSAPKPEVTTITLGDPTLSFATFYRYTNNASEELLIPSLIFPVKTVAGSNPFFYRQNVVVPLAKDIFDEQGSMPRPMPLDVMVAPTPEPSPEAPAADLNRP